MSRPSLTMPFHRWREQEGHTEPWHDPVDDNVVLLILWPSGVYWSNQAGGCQCAHPVAEGYPWVLAEGADSLNEVLTDPKAPWHDIHIGDMTPAMADVLDALLCETTAGFVETARDYLAESGEAWVIVRVAGPARLYGVLAWENSD